VPQRDTSACREQGTPVTHQRLAVFCVLLESPGHPVADKISAVHYVRFKLPPAMQVAFGANGPVVITLDHPQYHARTELPRPQVAELAKDLAQVSDSRCPSAPPSFG
jgi:hypothetical protein